MSENTDIPGIDGLVSAITGEDPGTLFGYVFPNFNARSIEILLKSLICLLFQLSILTKNLSQI